MAKDSQGETDVKPLEKCPTGIQGLDELTFGGLPRGRPTLLCGAAGSGKTLFAMEFLVRGATQFNEPGAFMSFEETSEELATNVVSLGFHTNELVRRKKLAFDYVYIEPAEIEETGEYDLSGLFVRLDSMIESVGARRVVLDSIEVLFSGLRNAAMVRAELRRLFRWLKKKKVTAIITGEQGSGTLTRHGLEEYVSDCVIFLDHRIHNQVATRRLRIVKYRGSLHGTNEYPTLIDEEGLSVMPVSSMGLNYPVATARVSTGIPRLDTMLGGQGYYRGSSILVTGTAGTGKTSIAVAFADSICRRGENCVYFSFEESPDQIIRNMASIGYRLEEHAGKGRLLFQAVRPTLYGLEMHLATMHKVIDKFSPAAVVVDPVTNMVSIGNQDEIMAMLSRVIDFMKNKGITAVFTSLTGGGMALEQSDVGISSLMDTWFLVRMVESNGERNRLLYIMKSRGMAHSNQMREFNLTDHGVDILDVYVGSGAVLTGTARLAQEARDRAAAESEQVKAELRRRELEQERSALRAQAEALQLKIEDLEVQLDFNAAREQRRLDKAVQEKTELKMARHSD